jgi:hypothetical protein
VIFYNAVLSKDTAKFRRGSKVDAILLKFTEHKAKLMRINRGCFDCFDIIEEFQLI